MKAAKTNKNGRVFSYMRWSSEPQSWGDSEKRQARAAQEWCKQHSRTLYEKPFADRGVSAWKGLHRTEGALNSLLKTARDGDTILIENSDRWSREETMDAMNALRDTVRNGIEVVFLATGITVNKDNFNDESVLIPLIFGALRANKENDRRSALIRASVRTRRETMESGTAVKGRLPAWLDWDVKNEKPVVNEAKAKSVRKLFDLCIGGCGLTKIEKVMRDTTEPITQRDTYKRQKTGWNAFFIHRTLSDRSVLGYQRSSGLKVYPAIVSEEIFYMAAAKLKHHSKCRSKSKGPNQSIFTGLCKCGECGQTYVRQRAVADGKAYDYLVCCGALRKLTQCKTLGYIRYDKLESSFVALLGQTDFIRELLDHKQEASGLLVLKGELEDIQRRCNKILKAFNDQDDPPRVLVDQLKKLEIKEREKQEEIQAQEMRLKTHTPAIAAYDRFQAEFAENIQKPDWWVE